MGRRRHVKESKVAGPCKDVVMPNQMPPLLHTPCRQATRPVRVPDSVQTTMLVFHGIGESRCDGSILRDASDVCSRPCPCLAARIG